MSGDSCSVEQHRRKQKENQKSEVLEEQQDE